MKVAYILDVFPKISETFILNEILEVQRQGVDVHVFSMARPEELVVHDQIKAVKNIDYLERPTACRIVTNHIWFIFNRPRQYMRALSVACNPRNQIWRHFLFKLGHTRDILRLKPDHIHAHFGQASSNMAMLVNLLTNIPYTFTTHGYDIFVSPPKNYKVKSALAKKHVAVSEYNKRYIIEKFKVDEKKIAVVHCGVDFTRVFPEPKNIRENIIVSIARLEHIKGLDVLVKACHLLKKEGMVFECLIAGEGSERGNLETLIHNLELVKEVKLLGDKTQDQVFDLLSRAKIKVLPSRSESMGVALMEAMVMKVPVIGPNVRGVSELIQDGKNGFLVDPENDDILAEKIKILMNDSKLRLCFKEEGYKKVKDGFNLQQETGKLVSIWTAS